MIVLACIKIHRVRSQIIGLFSGGKRLAGDVDWAHPEGHLWRVRDEEGKYLLWVTKERRYLLWVPLADHCGGLREKMLAPALRIYAVLTALKYQI